MDAAQAFGGLRGKRPILAVKAAGEGLTAYNPSKNHAKAVERDRRLSGSGTPADPDWTETASL